MHKYARFLIACSLAAACGGGSTDGHTEEQTNEAMTSAGSAAPAPRAAQWTGTQFCTGSANGEPLKSSEEAALGSFEKSRTRVTFSGITVGPSEEYSCADLVLEGLVTMGSQAGVFFDGGAVVMCTSPTGRPLTAELLRGHDTDLRYIDPTEPPTLSFEVALVEEVARQRDNLGIEGIPSRFNCSFDLELR
jgi:hypothetical protein